MSELCNCPNTGGLVEIPNSDCPFDLKQLQRLIIQKIGYKFDTSGSPATDPSLKADWDVLLSATDNTKAIITPLLTDIKVIPGDFIKTGGGSNETLNGIEKITGFNPTKVTAKAESITPEQEVALKKLMCQPVMLYFVNQEGDIFAKKVDNTKTTGFPTLSIGVKDRTNEGFGTNDYNDIEIAISPRWSEKLKRISPQDFDALYELV